MMMGDGVADDMVVMVWCLADFSYEEAGWHGKGEMVVDVECWWCGVHDCQLARGLLDYLHTPDQVKSDCLG